jgi:hypothetical protein
VLKSKNIKASVFQYIATNYSGNVNWDTPSRFDPDAADTESWVAFFVDLQDFEPSRSATDEGRVLLEFDIRSRKQDKAYEIEELLDDVRAVLSKGMTIPIVDYDDSDEPTVGYVRLTEPVIRDLTEDNDQWRRANVTIEGRVQEIP